MENTSSKKVDWKNFRDWLQVIVIIAATLIGAYEFVYKDVYKPSIRPTSLNVKANIELVGKKDGMCLVRCKVVTENPTDRRIYIPAFWLTVRAYAIDEELPNLIKMNRELEETNKKLKKMLLSIYPRISEAELSEIQSPYRENCQSSRNMNVVINDSSSLNPKHKLYGELTYQKKLVDDSFSWWEPMDKTTNEVVFAVPAGIYDYLEMSVNYFHTRYINDISEPSWSINQDSSLMVSFSLMEHSSDSTAFAEWQKRTASGYNWNITTLPLWE